MVRHNAVLKHSQCRLDLWHGTDAVLNYRAERTSRDAHIGQRTTEGAEAWGFGALCKGDVVNTPGMVVVCGEAWHLAAFEGWNKPDGKPSAR